MPTSEVELVERSLNNDTCMDVSVCDGEMEGCLDHHYLVVTDAVPVVTMKSAVRVDETLGSFQV